MVWRMLITVAITILSLERVSFAINRPQFHRNIDDAIELLKSSQISIGDTLALYDEVLKKRNERKGIYDDFFLKSSDAPVIEDEFKIQFLVHAIRNQRKVKEKFEKYLNQLVNLKELGLKGTQEVSDEVLIYETSQVFEALLDDRVQFLHQRKLDLETQTKENGVGRSVCKVVSTLPGIAHDYPGQEYDAQRVTNEFVDRDFVMVLLYPFVKSIYLSPNVRYSILFDPHFKDLLERKIEYYKTPDEALGGCLGQFSFPNSSISKLIVPNRDLRRDSEKYLREETNEIKGIAERWVKEHFETKRSQFYEFLSGFTSDEELIKFGFTEPAKQALVKEDPLFLLESEEFLVNSRYLFAGVGDLGAFEYFLSELKRKQADLNRKKLLAEKKANQELQLKQGVKNRKQEVKSGLPSFDWSQEQKKKERKETIDFERSKNKKRKNCTDPKDFQRTVNPDRAQRREEKGREYQARLESAAQASNQPEDPEAEAEAEINDPGTEKKPGLSKKSIDFMRNLFVMGEYDKTGRNLRHFWKKFLKAYADIKRLRQGIPNATPDSSQGNGSARTLTNEFGMTRTVHEIHGPKNYVGHGLADRIQEIFSDFGWTPQSFGIYE